MHVFERRAWPDFEEASPRVTGPTEAWFPEQTDRFNRHHLKLARLVEGEIVPQLVLANRIAEQGGLPAHVDGIAVSAAAVDQFTVVVLTQSQDAACAFVDAVQADGVAMEAIFIDLFRASALRLDEMWLDDLVDFTEVTAGLWRLQQLVRAFGQAFHGTAPVRFDGRRALMLTVAGEQNGFSLVLLGEFLRRAGWSPSGGPGLPDAETVNLVKADRFALACVSISRESRLAPLTAMIRRIRHASRNRFIGVMVDGPMFVGHPELIAQVGADIAALSPEKAPFQAETLISLVGQRR